MKKILLLLAIGLVGMSSPVSAAEEEPAPTSTIFSINGPADVGVPSACDDVYGYTLPNCVSTDVCNVKNQTVYHLVPCEYDRAAFVAWCNVRDPGHPACQVVYEPISYSPTQELPATGLASVLVVAAFALTGLGVILLRRIKI